MYLYQNDVLEEEIMSTWHQKLPTGQVKDEVSVI